MTIHINRDVNPPEAQGCHSGLHMQNQATPDGEWHGIYEPGGDYDNPVNYALFGLARQTEEHFPTWVKMQTGKPMLDLGPGNKLVPGADRLDYPEYDFLMLRQPPRSTRNDQEYQGDTKHVCRLPYEDESVGGIVAANILEHLWDPRPIMDECARVLTPGAPLNIFVPHGLSQVYIQDLDHKKPFNLDSFKNWLFNPFYWDRTTPLRINTLFKFAVKEGNEIVVAQLVKTEDQA